MPSALGIGEKLWFLEGLGKELPAISRVINSKQIQLLSGVDVSLVRQRLPSCAPVGIFHADLSCLASTAPLGKRILKGLTYFIFSVQLG